MENKREEYKLGKAHGRADLARGIKSNPPDKRWVDDGRPSAMQADRPYWQGYTDAQSEHLLSEVEVDWWKGDLLREPIPGRSLQEALDYLIEIGEIQTSGHNQGQSWLAEKVGVSPEAVRNWVTGSAPCQGPAAMQVRVAIKEALRVPEIPL